MLVVQTGIDVYIPRHKYQVKPHSSPWFSANCADAKAHRNHFFCLYHKNKSSASKMKFRQPSNLASVAKGFLKLTILLMLIKQNISLLRNLALTNYGELLIVVSTKVKLLYFFHLTNLRCCFLLLKKQKFLQKSFLRT